jgi:hypothetical protein
MNETEASIQRREQIKEFQAMLEIAANQMILLANEDLSAMSLDWIQERMEFNKNILVVAEDKLPKN